MKKLLLSLLTVAAGISAQATDYELVSSNDALEVGANYILVANNSDATVAMGIYESNKNNVGGVTVTAPVNNVITIGDEAVGVITLETSGRTDGYNYQLKVEGGYLYAASTSKNYMKVTTNPGANAQASIDVAESGVATIKFDNNNARNWIRFNPNGGSPIFACYTSGQQDVYLYKEKTGDEPIATVETPEINPATGKFGGPQLVSIYCATEGAAIYYTTDGSAPTNESTAYTEPFTVSETTTVKAIAYVDTDASKVASSTITILNSYESLASILNFGPKPEVGATSEEFIVACDLIVAYVNGANVIVTDEVGHSYSLIYKYDTGLQPGDVVAGGWVAAIQNFKGLNELIPAGDLTTNGTATEPAFEEITDMSVLNDESYVCHIVVVKNVSFAEATPEAAANFTANQNGTDYTLYNKFKLASVEAGLYDVTMVVWMYNSLSYYPLEYTAIPTIEVPENLYIMGAAFGSDHHYPNLITMEKEGNKFTYSGVADDSQLNYFVFTTNNESEIKANAYALSTAEERVAVDNTYELLQGYAVMLIDEGSYTLTVTYYDYYIELSIANYDSSVLDITNDDAAPVEYYNLQGVRVAEPTAGALYIVRQGTTATKRAF